jgi:hypothetical protein
METKRVLNFKKFMSTGTLTVFDIDETLFHTTAKILVKRGDETVRSLTNQEFNTYSLKPGESFDFAEFGNAEKFYSESRPIHRMLDKAKRILNSIKINPLNKVIIVTARANFDNKERFLDTFRAHGLDIDQIRVERAGNITDIKSTAVKKYVIIRNYAATGQFSRVKLFDDSMENLVVFLKLRQEFPEIIFEAYFVEHDGSVKKV